jgi:hypothetical protein
VGRRVFEDFVLLLKGDWFFLMNPTPVVDYFLGDFFFLPDDDMGYL